LSDHLEGDIKAWDETWASGNEEELWTEPEPFVLAQVERLRAQGVERVLDLGTGLGRHAIALAGEGFSVYGLDGSPSGLAYARQWARREDLTLPLVRARMEAMPWQRDVFGAVLAWNVLYHGLVADVEQALDEVRHCLCPGGYLITCFISTANLHYGQGIALEDGTYVDPEAGEKAHPHHYMDRAEIERRLWDFEILYCEDVDHWEEDYHWQVLARYNG
jgi:SAM-dependent methyltransferase